MSELIALEMSLRQNRERFEQLLSDVRPELYRYCSRMVGSPLDGEDLVQEVLAQAYYKLSLLKQDLPVRPWLFRIAHNKCIDFLRARRAFTEPLNETLAEEESMTDAVDIRQRAQLALEELVLGLPPKERGCVILKDILDCSLKEISDYLNMSLAAVKAALHRGRTKIERAERPTRRDTRSERTLTLMRAYSELFNQRDWDGVRQLIRDDAQLEVLNVYHGLGVPSFRQTYFGNYQKMGTWRTSVATLHAEPVLVVWSDSPARLKSVVRLTWQDGKVIAIRDYIHVEYLVTDIADQGILK